MRLLLLLSLLLTTACSLKAAPTTPPPPPETLADLMQEKISPYASGKSHDQAAFLYALSQLRELAPPESGFNSGPRPWFQIVDDMAANKDAKRGCQECHRLYKRTYKERYSDSPIIWVEPPPAAK